MKFKRGLFFDELDIFIIRNIKSCYDNNSELNTWEMAKDYVSSLNQRKISEIYQLKKPDVDDTYRKIKTKIKRYLSFGFIKTTKNGGVDDIFELDLDKITFAKHKFSDGYSNCLIFRV